MIMGASSVKTPTFTTALCWAPFCRTLCGPHSRTSSRRGSATISVVSFSTSSLASCGASTFTIGNVTFICPKVVLFYPFFWPLFLILFCYFICEHRVLLSITMLCLSEWTNTFYNKLIKVWILTERDVSI